MNITRPDLNVFYHQVHQNVAKKIGIQDFEWKSIEELEAEIQNKNSEISSKVKSFIQTYTNWYKVHEKIEKTGSSGNLSTEENSDLMNAIQDRDAKRAELIEELNK